MLSEFKEGHTMSLAYSDKELAIREELANSMDIHPDATSHYRTYPSIRDYYEGNRKDKSKPTCTIVLTACIAIRVLL